LTFPVRNNIKRKVRRRFPAPGTCGSTFTITQRDVREGGEIPPLPRNCKRAQLRPVFEERLNGPEGKPTGVNLWEGNPAIALSGNSLTISQNAERASQETGPL
jgi:hypothetical protein